MSQYKVLFQLFAVLACTWLTFSCKSLEVPDLPEMPKVPATFLGSTDTLSIGNIPWEEFFDDPYLTRLIETALQNNLNLMETVERIDIAHAHYRIRNGALYPSLEGLVSYSHSGNAGGSAEGSGDLGSKRQSTSNFIGFISSWELDLWGKLRNRREAAQYRILSTEMGQRLVTTALVAEVAMLYYDLLGYDMELETIEKNIEFQKMALELIKIQKLAGRATELAVQQFAAQLLSTQSLRYKKQQEIVEAENALDFLLGRFPEPIARAESLSEIRLPQVINTGIPADLLLRRPDIQQAELELLASKLDLKAARAAFFPSLVLSPEIGLSGNTVPGTFEMPGSLTYGVLAGLTSPIFQQGRIRAEYDMFAAENRISLLDYQEAVLQGFGEVVTSLRRVENLKNLYALKEEETQILLKAVSTSNDLFRGGYASYLEVITAQSRALEAELEMASTRKEVFQSVITLYRALGGGWN